MNTIWLLKTEPDTFSLQDLQACPNGTTGWDGVRNYQARNRLRDEMREGDTVLIYHSSCAVPAIVGEARVVSAPYPDPSQFDPDSPGHDSRSTHDTPRWYQVDIRYLSTFPQPLALKTLREYAEFADMELVIRPRLSVQKVTERQYQMIQQLCLPVNATA
ncbi:MAG: EVE domain-containing protein [Pseudomonadota bacterium]|nr:EVE domain-containing protein [Pseudomonadota bacterium]